VLTDLDAVTECSITTLPLIRFLQLLYRAKLDEGYGFVDNHTYLSAISTYVKYCSDTYRAGFGPMSTTSPGFGITDFSVHWTDHTLDAGAISDAALYAPGAAYYYLVYWGMFGTTFNAAVAQNYYFTFVEEDGSSHYAVNWIGSCYQPVIQLHHYGSADDKDFQLNVTGGNGAEHIQVGLVAGKAT